MSFSVLCRTITHSSRLLFCGECEVRVNRETVEKLYEFNDLVQGYNSFFKDVLTRKKI